MFENKIYIPFKSDIYIPYRNPSIVLLLVYILIGTTSQFRQTTQLDAPNPIPGLRFGKYLALSESTLVVGTAYGQDVYIYEKNHNNSWTLVQQLSSTSSSSSSSSSSGSFGRSVVIYGDIIVVGEPTYNDNTGIVHVFQKSQGKNICLIIIYYLYIHLIYLMLNIYLYKYI